MAEKLDKASAGAGGMFVIGLVFTMLGLTLTHRGGNSVPSRRDALKAAGTLLRNLGEPSHDGHLVRRPPITFDIAQAYTPEAKQPILCRPLRMVLARPSD